MLVTMIRVMGKVTINGLVSKTQMIRTGDRASRGKGRWVGSKDLLCRMPGGTEKATRALRGRSCPGGHGATTRCNRRCWNCHHTGYVCRCGCTTESYTTTSPDGPSFLMPMEFTTMPRKRVGVAGRSGETIVHGCNGLRWAHGWSNGSQPGTTIPGSRWRGYSPNTAHLLRPAIRGPKVTSLDLQPLHSDHLCCPLAPLP